MGRAGEELRTQEGPGGDQQGGRCPAGPSGGQGAPDRRALPPGQLGAPPAATATLWAPSWGLLVMISQTPTCTWVSPRVCQLPQLPPLPRSPLTQAGRVLALGHLLLMGHLPSCPGGEGAARRGAPRGSSSSCPPSAAVQQTRLVSGAVNSYTHVVPPFTELMRSQRWGPLPGGTRAYEWTGQDGATESRDSAVGRRVGAGTEPPGGLSILTACEDSPVP